MKKWTKEYEKQYMIEYRKKNRVKLRAQFNKWRKEHRERNTQINREERSRLKWDVFQHYSSDIPSCSSCGHTDMRALQIDHIDNNGSEERIRIFGKRTQCGTKFYRWLRKNGFPTGYQVLCANCNFIKREPSYSDSIYNQRFKTKRWR